MEKTQEHLRAQRQEGWGQTREAPRSAGHSHGNHTAANHIMKLGTHSPLVILAT